ncbi:hypothetical protein FDG46_15365 [Clostridium botulinum]|nr:hypothetical protein DB732_12995 [Clostridium botulinum]EGT5615343.1 hypothetical protein [Clostridium botulinum]EGT5622194.1 hypothetical protein [Clostridium botulinum]EGT5626973.1 hypothetical protein [Clostridium botulinum]EGT5630792.1 hypothetical protein [Clostridium botulinum]
MHLKIKSIFRLHFSKTRIYPMTTRSNTPIALCESDSHQIEDLDSLLFFKVGVKSGYVPG